ncbi:FbpB family small basic protein [Cytobacillus depressus]|uniref:FbpB family small basic protein n=1 Tax=Cytobacillus depressus TaxID=1602942 RepID=A0A6L3UZH4_9BACI|nr:FbpB family small basic protein [Cytobacillus depressus]
MDLTESFNITDFSELVIENKKELLNNKQ